MTDAATIPSRGESLIDFLGEGYAFGSRNFERLATDTFRTRLLGVPVTFLRGAEASRFFYGTDGPQRFTRHRAIPAFVQHLLQDRGSVQTLDGEAHRHRKAAFVHLLMGPAAGDITDVLAEEWQRAVRQWSRHERIELHRQAQVVLTRVALRWSGIPLDGTDVRQRAKELAAMVDRVALVGPGNWSARAMRRRTESWAAGLVRDVRDGRLVPPPDSALAVLARHRDLDDHLLDVEVAAVELINVLRPIVAVSRFVTFAALALIERPTWAETFAAGDEADLTGFVHEVRRYYPFFPAIPGRARYDISWHGERLRAGAWVILDLYGTNHDPSVWEHPETFTPERFRHWDGDPDTLVPQGGGDVRSGHRCPGERVTIELMKESVRQLTRGMRYEVPVQDTSVRLNLLPALPREGVLLRRVTSV